MTWAVLLPLVLKAWPVIVGVLGWLGARVYYKRQGAAEERAKQAAAEQKARDVADQVDNDLSLLTPEQKREELGKWSKS